MKAVSVLLLIFLLIMLALMGTFMIMRHEHNMQRASGQHVYQETEPPWKAFMASVYAQLMRVSTMLVLPFSLTASVLPISMNALNAVSTLPLVFLPWIRATLRRLL